MVDAMMTLRSSDASAGSSFSSMVTSRSYASLQVVDDSLPRSRIRLIFSLNFVHSQQLFHNRHRAIGHMADSMGDAPKEKLLNSGQAPASHNDMIDSFRRCKFDDPSRRISFNQA
jgi:hypothetical protein